jgi:hypothetical protein
MNWISIHEKPVYKSLEENPNWKAIEYCHRDKEKMLFRWIEKRGQNIIQLDLFGLRVNPTHYRVINNK